VHSEAPFLRSVAIQLRVIGALLMREIITRYGRANLGFLWLFVEPMLFTLGITALWTALSLHKTSTLPIVAFAVTGYSTVLLWRNCAMRCAMAIPPNVGLLYHRNVRVLDLLIARITLECAGATTSFFLLSCVWISLGWMDAPSDLALVLAGWLLLAWFGAGLAVIVGSLTAYSEVVEKLWHPISYFLFPISGAVFMVDWLPRPLRELALWVPMVNAVELIRDGFFGPVVRTHYDVEYLFLSCMVTTLVGLVLVTDASRRVEMQ
jgi:capsular polysaccharide transport system permease protein